MDPLQRKAAKALIDFYAVMNDAAGKELDSSEYQDILAKARNLVKKSSGGKAATLIDDRIASIKSKGGISAHNILGVGRFQIFQPEPFRIEYDLDAFEHQDAISFEVNFVPYDANAQ